VPRCSPARSVGSGSSSLDVIACSHSTLHAGIGSAHAAGMRVIAIPNPSFPPGDDALAHADIVLGSLAELTPEAVEAS